MTIHCIATAVEVDATAQETLFTLQLSPLVHFVLSPVSRAQWVHSYNALSLSSSQPVWAHGELHSSMVKLLKTTLKIENRLLRKAYF